MKPDVKDSGPIPPDGCICASFWTVRQTHKKDCPAYEPPKESQQNKELQNILVAAFDKGYEVSRSVTGLADDKFIAHQETMVEEAKAAITVLLDAAFAKGLVEVDTTNIHDWVDRGLGSTDTDVWFRCLQLINDELEVLHQRGEATQTIKANGEQKESEAVDQ